jgi:hypothetical protein
MTLVPLPLVASTEPFLPIDVRRMCHLVIGEWETVET